MPPQPRNAGDRNRRSLLKIVAAGSLNLPLLVACGDGGAAGKHGVLSEAVTVPVAEVPVGGGTILREEMVVVTQPVEGQFMAFSAVCTHQGCPVQSIRKGRIQCPCHGSEFSAKDGSVVAGPASSPLKTLSVIKNGQQIQVT